MLFLYALGLFAFAACKALCPFTEYIVLPNEAQGDVCGASRFPRYCRDRAGRHRAQRLNGRQHQQRATTSKTTGILPTSRPEEKTPCSELQGTCVPVRRGTTDTVHRYSQSARPSTTEASTSHRSLQTTDPHRGSCPCSGMRAVCSAGNRREHGMPQIQRALGLGICTAASLKSEMKRTRDDRPCAAT